MKTYLWLIVVAVFIAMPLVISVADAQQAEYLVELSGIRLSAHATEVIRAAAANSHINAYPNTYPHTHRKRTASLLRRAAERRL